MATGGGNTAVFNCQMAACRYFFEEQLPENKWYEIPKNQLPKNINKFKGPCFDITGLDARHVVSLLVHIVNDREQFTKNRTFYLWIHNSHENKADYEIDELFRLTARPSPDQPGNGIVFLRQRNRTKFRGSGKTYAELNGDLEAAYEKYGLNATAYFAKDIKNLFKNNEVANNDFPEPTIIVYMLWLFEIARRLVKVNILSTKKQEFDILPIGSAIARILKLMEFGDEKICTFKDVLLPKGIQKDDSIKRTRKVGKYHCFAGAPMLRKDVIDNINKDLDQVRSSQVNHTTVTETKDDLRKRCLEELRETFSGERSLADELTHLSLRLTTRGIEKTSERPLKSSMNSETFTVYDHLETRSTPMF